MNKLTYCILFIILFLISIVSFAQQNKKVLIVMDEKPQMEVLAKFFSAGENIITDIVDQEHLPQKFSDYRAVIYYIHGGLSEEAEKAVIDYTKGGGKYICLHHSISSGKANNKYYFDFLGIQLDDPEFSPYPVKPGGGYGWLESDAKGINYMLVNLNPNAFVTNNKIEWGQPVDYQSSDDLTIKRKYPAIVFKNTEAYFNHKFTDGREKTVLCGFKFLDPRNNELFMQDRAVWYKPYGKGIIYYFMPGHFASDYENKNLAQMILNAIMYDGKE